MAAPDNVVGQQNLRVDEFTTDVVAVLFSRRRWGAIERDISALRTDNELLACRISRGDQLLDGRADRALRSLTPVVDRRVDQVDPASDRCLDRGFVSAIVIVSAVAEIGADANRGGSQP